ncbi:MAG TPA: hypothetical protein VJ576_13810 [Rhodocyclaceae bacterium]|nr:hypothetical protein [Rhodocyclaceae bacterium]
MHKFDPTDHSAHLAEILAQLYKLEDLVAAGDREALLALVTAMDWHTVADEFELVVANHYLALEHLAHRVSYNLQRPYLQLQDCINLERQMRLLEEAIDESPSLLDDADGTVAQAWSREVAKAERRRRPLREMPPVASLNELRIAVAAKVGLGRALAGRHGAFDAGERVAYDGVDGQPAG